MASTSLDPFFHLTSLPYVVLRPPKLRLRLPTLSFPHPMVVYGLVIFSYFLVVSGFVFDVIVEPPGVGGHQDPATGKWVPEALLPQFLLEPSAMASTSLDPFFHLTSLPYVVLRPPKLRLRLPTLSFPHPMVVYGLVIFSYFLVVSGFVFDVIVEPPGVGGHQDPATGKWVPEVFMAGRINQQYIIEGLSAGFMFVIGGLGIVAVNSACDKNQAKNMRLIYLGTGVSLVVLSYTMSMVFLRIKMPGYLS
eukprot:TRINITY_DN79465_c0_g1_i1.p1 TRINITY_DN79465_c0_g1~~TRINITY_DN79465_c0_g1_i1.p1  ORF type:complete len:268 (+),score=-7.55 TRINITY_DN79465_c0_g1_i1:59-805(+)